MKKLNKKAEVEMYSSDTFIFYIVFGIFLSVLIVMFMLTIYKNLEETAKIPAGIEEFSAVKRMFSAECFALDDINHPRTINWSRFTKKNLDKCYNVNKESKKAAFILELQIPNDKKRINTTNWNDEIGPKRIKPPIETKVYHNNRIIDGKMIISEQNV